MTEHRWRIAGHSSHVSRHTSLPALSGLDFAVRRIPRTMNDAIAGFL